MPPKRGVKRSANGAPLTGPHAVASLTTPDRATWPGWVEIESEPALFNVMLRDMGVQGLKIQELYSIEDDELTFLPQPVHALIFLFQYNSRDEEESAVSSPPADDLWFANQIPDFACATVALMNIVNNIPGLSLGSELQAFRDATDNMDPVSRGKAIDDFDFVRRIHNSFATDTELLSADMHVKKKLARFKRRQAAIKANATKAAKKAAQAAATAVAAAVAERETEPAKHGTTQDTSEIATYVKVGQASVSRDTKGHASQSREIQETVVAETPFASPLSDLAESTPCKQEPTFVPELDRQVSHTRHSKRQADAQQPRLNSIADECADEEGDGGYHFVAYMPIHGHVWKMDGLNSFPQDLGSYDDKGARPTTPDDDDPMIAISPWLQVVQPYLAERMAQFAGSVSFNLMAVVHDALHELRQKLLANTVAVEAIEQKLDGLSPQWRAREEATSSSTQTPIAGLHSANVPGLGVYPADLDAFTPAAIRSAAEPPPSPPVEPISSPPAGAAGLEELLQLRKRLATEQIPLRTFLRDAHDAETRDSQMARHRRHDYDRFVREWMEALAKEGLLADLLEM